MDLSSEMVYPLVPLFLSSVLGVNKSVIGLIEGITESAASIIGGFLWDKYGPQATFCFGAFTASVSAVLLIIIYGMDLKEDRKLDNAMRVLLSRPCLKPQSSLACFFPAQALSSF